MLSNLLPQFYTWYGMLACVQSTDAASNPTPNSNSGSMNPPCSDSFKGQNCSNQSHILRHCRVFMNPAWRPKHIQSRLPCFANAMSARIFSPESPHDFGKRQRGNRSKTIKLLVADRKSFADIEMRRTDPKPLNWSTMVAVD